MGCASSQTTAGQSHKPSETINSNIAVTEESSNVTVKYPPAEAFEISLDDSNAMMSSVTDSTDKLDSIIKKHPPKRLQRLVEQSGQQQLTTIEDLEEKLAKAEIRRKQYLQQKIVTVVTLKQQNQKQDNTNDTEPDQVNESLSRSPGDGNDQTDHHEN